MINLEDYDYYLPPELIAKEPALPRDHSRLMIYDTTTDQVTFDYFYNLHHFLPSDSFLVLNNTKVLPARVKMKKENGGVINILFLVNEVLPDGFIRAFVDREVKIGQSIVFDPQYKLIALKQEDHIVTFQHLFSRSKLFQLLEQYGTMPIPLYIKKSPLSPGQLHERYQTIFAKTEGSTAAPTASLHFTEDVFTRLAEKGIEKAFLTLHVGMGTFAPLEKSHFETKKLPAEWYELTEENAEIIRKLRAHRKKLVAVGTTVVRTLESIAKKKVIPNLFRDPINNHRMLKQVQHDVGSTDLFITLPHRFTLTDVLITNFHLPKTSLMLLVNAFLHHKKAKRTLPDLYRLAIEQRMRFYSFGDVMLVL